MDKIKIAISTCPNDTFMFEALYNKRIDMQGFEFEWKFADINELNKDMIREVSDVSKVSFNAFYTNRSRYALLSVGAALGYNCGPQLIAGKPLDMDRLDEITVAIPGEDTTANLLLSVFYPEIVHKQEMVFSDIAMAVKQGAVDAGLIIHETRFTYPDLGLYKIADMGELWEQEYHLPLPLGAIAANKRLNPSTISSLETLIRESIGYGFNHFEETMSFVKQFAQEMKDEVVRAHIHLYVNQYSVHLGEKGNKAINLLFSHIQQK